MSNINFKPWIGKNYFINGYKGKRILVLGESHYCMNELSKGGRCYPICKKENMRNDCFSQTEDVLDYYLNRYSGLLDKIIEMPMDTIVKLFIALEQSGRWYKEIDVVAFLYNYYEILKN